MVYSWKGEMEKARLCAQGFSDVEGKLLDSSAPTCRKDTWRLVCAVCARLGWEPQSIDIKTAFLQGKEMERDVFLEPPKEANEVPGWLWKLLRPVYGLVDSPERWYLRVVEILVGVLKGTQSKFDKGLFYWKNAHGAIIGIMSIHVDDFYFGGGAAFEGIVGAIDSHVKVGSREKDDFVYAGVHVKKTMYTPVAHPSAEVPLPESVPKKVQIIETDVNHYIRDLKPISIPKGPDGQELGDDEPLPEDTPLREIVGELLWAAVSGRPDIFFRVSRLASKVGKPDSRGFENRE
jgi:hypothetical protein